MQISDDWKPGLYALAAALIGLITLSTIDRLQRERVSHQEHRQVFNELSQLRARMEGVLSGNLLMVHGLSAVIAANPDLDQAAFSRIAHGMVTPDNALRNIGGAPDLVIRLMYPLQGNEAAIGLDYRTHPTQRATALRAIESGETVVAGPLDLVQGGKAVIAREPVYLAPGHPDAKPTLWGLVSAVIDVERLYRLSGLTRLQSRGDLTLAIRGRDGKGADGEVFYGEAAVFGQRPEVVTVTLPGGSWQLAAIPADGWGSLVRDATLLPIRLAGLLITVVIAVLSYAVSRNAIALRRTATDLEEAQRLFRGFMDHLPAGAFVRDIRDKRTLFQNTWLERHLPGNGHDPCIENVIDPLRLKSAPHLEHHALDSADGGRIECDTLLFPLRDGGKRDLVGGVVMDVSERVRAEQALASSRARLRALLNTIPDLVWMKDPDGVYLACNHRFEAFFGAKEAEIIGKRDHDFVSAEQADAFRRDDQATVNAGQATIRDETVNFLSDGHSELLETIKTPVYDEAGRLMGVLGIARDVTARRAAEEALRANAERLRTAESIAHIGNWEYRVADGAVTWSDETYRILGIEPGSRKPDYAWLLSQIHPDDRPAHDAFMRRMLSARPGDDIPEERFRLQRDDLRELVISIHVSIDFGPDDTPVRLFGTVQDVTEREALMHDQRERLDELTRWQSVILGREDRIIELKGEVNTLLREQGQSPRYATDGAAS